MWKSAEQMLKSLFDFHAISMTRIFLSLKKTYFQSVKSTCCLSKIVVSIAASPRKKQFVKKVRKRSLVWALEDLYLAWRKPLIIMLKFKHKLCAKIVYNPFWHENSTKNIVILRAKIQAK